MLLMRELARVASNVVRFSISTRRIWLLLAIVVIAIAALATTTVTVIGPVALYPLI